MPFGFFFVLLFHNFWIYDCLYEHVWRHQGWSRGPYTWRNVESAKWKIKNGKCCWLFVRCLPKYNIFSEQVIYFLYQVCYEVYQAAVHPKSNEKKSPWLFDEGTRATLTCPSARKKKKKVIPAVALNWLIDILHWNQIVSRCELTYDQQNPQRIASQLSKGAPTLKCHFKTRVAVFASVHTFPAYLNPLNRDLWKHCWPLFSLKTPMLRFSLDGWKQRPFLVWVLLSHCHGFLWRWIMLLARTILECCRICFVTNPNLFSSILYSCYLYSTSLVQAKKLLVLPSL